MRHQKRIRKIGTDKSHRTSLLRNLAMNVIIHEKIRTTKTKAKAAQPYIEKVITMGKKEDKMHVIRELKKMVNHEDCSRKVMEVLVDRYKDRSSGYTRITNAGNRPGDNASMVYLELVQSDAKQSEASKS